MQKLLTDFVLKHK